jgi:hypothetical protein
MNSSTSNHIEPLDHKSTRSICEAVGERLQQTLRPDSAQMSSYLKHLVHELRALDEKGGSKSN